MLTGRERIGYKEANTVGLTSVKQFFVSIKGGRITPSGFSRINLPEDKISPLLLIRRFVIRSTLNARPTPSLPQISSFLHTDIFPIPTRTKFAIRFGPVGHG